MKKIYLLGLIAGLLASPLSQGATIVDAALDFSDTQGKNGLYYGTILHSGGYSTDWYDSWANYVSYNAVTAKWYDASKANQSGLYTTATTLATPWTWGSGLYWVVDQNYDDLSVTAGRTGGDSWTTYVLFWDTSEGVGYQVNVGSFQTTGTYSILDTTGVAPQAGDLIAIIMNAGPGTGKSVTYEFSVSTIPEASNSGLIGGLIVICAFFWYKRRHCRR
jgi:hypothetical protein